jgi:anti-anti-sigma factor
MEALKIEVSKLTDDVWKLTIDGVVDPSNAAALQSAFDDLFKKGVAKVVIDLKRVKYLSSSGIACFITALDVAIGKGGHLVFIAAPPQISRIAELLGLSEVFTFADDEAAALEQFASGSK